MIGRPTWRARAAATGLTALLALAGGAGVASAQAPGGATGSAPDALSTPAASPTPSVVTERSQIDELRSQLRDGTLARTRGVSKICADNDVRCLAQTLTTGPGSRTRLITGDPIGYGATELQKAYGLPSTAGKAGSGPTVAILGTGAYPNLESDLTIYRDAYRLPRCTTDNGCLKIVDYRGGKPLPASEDELGALVEEIVSVETALDVQMASAACPTCKIVFGQLPWEDGIAPTQDDQDAATSHFAAGTKTAVRLGAKAVSISYGYDVTQANLTGQTAKAISQRGVAVVAASGDSGFSADLGLWPQSLPTVISAGGTSLYTAPTKRGYADVAWSGAGSGCTFGVGPANGQPRSVSKLCDGARASSDVSAVADPATGVAVYNSYSPAFGFPPGFIVVGGTSASSPFLAGVAARLGVPASTLGPNLVYSAPKGSLNDVTLGQNAQPGVCAQAGFPLRLCAAGAGWDGPTGLGTPNGKNIFAGR